VAGGGMHSRLSKRDGQDRAEIEALLSRLGHETDGADSPAAALASIRERSPALVMLDVATGGLELCREIVEYSDSIPVILISADRTRSADRVAGLLAGADDYICKPFDPDELLARARRTIARTAPRSPLPAILPQVASVLSPQEREVLGLLVDGLTQREIASLLVISHKTVATHVQNIKSKLGVQSPVQAIALAAGVEPSPSLSAPRRPALHDVESEAV